MGGRAGHQRLSWPFNGCWWRCANVAVNLALVDPFTRKHGLEAHICELQLGLSDFDAHRDDEGHVRYVKFRNAVAE